MVPGGNFVSATWWKFSVSTLSILTIEPLGVGHFHVCCTPGVGHFLQYSKNLNVNSPTFVVKTNDWCINIQDFNEGKYVFSLCLTNMLIYTITCSDIRLYYCDIRSP